MNSLSREPKIAIIDAPKIKKNGSDFTRYNSIKIPFKKVEGHIFLAATVTGNAGVEDCIMMLDTGASMSVISLELAQKTGNAIQNWTWLVGDDQDRLNKLANECSMRTVSSQAPNGSCIRWPRCVARAVSANG